MISMRPKTFYISMFCILGIILLPDLGYAQGIPVPSITLGVKDVDNPNEVVGVLQILFILTVLALAPSIIYQDSSSIGLLKAGFGYPADASHAGTYRLGYIPYVFYYESNNR